MTENIVNVSTSIFDDPQQGVQCIELNISEKLQGARTIATIVFLGIINVAVIVGNALVILAVFASAKLRTVTNFIIMSLAVADLLVGIAVLPYSITLEVLEVWVFGHIWCQIWLAVDVWMCTASILNLVAISIDRYLAITRPVHYRSIMTSRRVKLLIASVWILSFLICFPPLVGWNDDSRSKFNGKLKANVTIDQQTETEDVFRELDLSQLSMFLNETFIEANDSIALSNVTNQTLTEWTETDSETNMMDRCVAPECSLIGNKGYVIYSALGSFYIPMLVMLFFYWRIYRAAIRTSRALQRGFKTSKNDAENTLTLRIHRGKPSTDVTVSQNYGHVRREGDMIVPRRALSAGQATLPTVRIKPAVKNRRSLQDMNGGYYPPVRTKELSMYNSPTNLCQGNLPGTSYATNGKSNRTFFTRISKRNARWHARRFHSEAKATKTVGIIVGGFILCWLPFFTVYLLRAFCDDCFSDIIFNIFFWLGYCNSAANPLIYGMFSKDFRAAFKKIVCRCKLKEDGITSLIKQIHMPTFFEDMPDDNSQE
ncbi:probable G-protein coupled receptor No9 [Centruroides sculpturatus]|uniref:probable G-protein coupled receptor No9 n=1 Tax=Centruroides sculpturatus TaxID=218467 RepID=UPI000C6CA67D|nr:probable G-protein coupled receptor No9 [Centruroides sculpturatus]